MTKANIQAASEEEQNNNNNNNNNDTNDPLSLATEVNGDTVADGFDYLRGKKNK